MNITKVVGMIGLCISSSLCAMTQTEKASLVSMSLPVHKSKIRSGVYTQVIYTQDGQVNDKKYTIRCYRERFFKSKKTQKINCILIQETDEIDTLAASILDEGSFNVLKKLYKKQRSRSVEKSNDHVTGLGVK